MKKCILILAAIFMSQVTVGQRFMTYNIRNGFGLDGRQRNLEAVAEVIRASSPDFVALQEVDSMAGRTGRTHVAADLAKLVGMEYVTYAKAIDFDGGAYGIALLSRRKPLSVRRIALPGREEARVAIVADFGGEYVIATHLSLTAEDRLSSIDTLCKIAKNLQYVYLMGDLNAQPHSPEIALLSKTFSIKSPVGGATYPADAPRDVIDYIAVKFPGAGIFKCVVIDAPTQSDHRPLLMTISPVKGPLPPARE